MSIRKPNKYAPDTSSHPGETLREMLKEREMLQTQLALEMDVADSYLSDFINCKRAAGTKLALRLEKALGVAAEFWLTMQMHHDLATARAAERKARK